MLPRTYVERLDFQRPNLLTFAAVQLIVDEVCHAGELGYTQRQEEVSEYIDLVDTSVEAGLAVTTEAGELLAAASTAEADKHTVCIGEIVVSPLERGKGYARVLVNYIAQTALDQDKQKLIVLTEQRAIFTKLGFQPSADGTMFASPQDVLRSSGSK